ncbi:MAG TPA: FAD-dependent oxidoreductase, partial [Dongiaceae bacterium]|nr:FAD-dependent oxidoreductase [Dongiaceae bacterium]
PLVVVSRDDAAFYSKPMLSNALASGKTAASLVMKPAERMGGDLDATILKHTAVAAIDAPARRLRLQDGRELAWRDLVLAVGADPIRLPLEGDAAAGVLSVNDLDDYARFADRLPGMRRVAILGAGLIGCEFANDLLSRGIAPVVIDIADRPLARLLPDAAGARLRERLEAAGVQFRFGIAARRVERDGDGVRLTLADGSTLAADLVLSAIGLRPRIGLAQAAGLATARGIVVDRRLATSAPHVHAVGDCAEVEGHWLPFVLPLMQQARALAATLAGTPTAVAYPAMPVVVKTPACPAVVCPPPAAAGGAWQAELSDDGCEARFHAASGHLLGFAVLEAATARKQALAAQVPAWLAAPPASAACVGH